MPSASPFQACLACARSVNAAVLAVTPHSSHNHIQGVMNGEDVTDAHILESVKAAVAQNEFVKRIVINGSGLRWANVAVAIIEGAQQNTALRELKLETPCGPRLQEVVEELREAKPKLLLVVRAGDGESLVLNCV